MTTTRARLWLRVRYGIRVRAYWTGGEVFTTSRNLSARQIERIVERCNRPPRADFLGLPGVDRREAIIGVANFACGIALAVFVVGLFVGWFAR